MKINELGESKYFANKGLKRNKKPLANIRYKVKLVTLSKEASEEDYKEYKFKSLGYLSLSWTKNRDLNCIWNYHGFITPTELKDLLGEKQWCKFCQGKREFIIQRRINKKNI